MGSWIKKYSWLISLIVLISLVVIVSNISNLFSCKDCKNPNTENYNINFTNNPDGILVQLYSDFECPYCGQVKSELFPVLNKYNGLINFEYKHLPIHENSVNAGEASECARDQGKFWEYYEVLYANQYDLSKNALKIYATNLGLDSTRFNTCLENNEKRSIIAKDYNDAVIANIPGTPTFVVDGKIVPEDVRLDTAIANQLSK